MTVTLWPDLIAWIVLGIAGFWALSFIYLLLVFTELGEKVLGVLFWALPFVALAWAVGVLFL